MAQGLLRERAFIRSLPFEELAPCMSHADDLGHAELKAGLVAARIVADQLAPPALREVASLLYRRSIPDSKHAGRVVQLLADASTDAFEGECSIGSEYCLVRDGSKCMETQPAMPCALAFASSRSELSLPTSFEVRLQSLRCRYRSGHRANWPAQDSSVRCAWQASNA